MTMRKIPLYRTYMPELKEAMRKRNLSIEMILHYSRVSKTSIIAARAGNRITQSVRDSIVMGLEDYDHENPARPKKVELSDKQRKALDEAQAAFDRQVDEAHREYFFFKQYSPDEIQAIQHKIIPLHCISKQAFAPEINPFADSYSSPIHRRWEDSTHV